MTEERRQNLVHSGVSAKQTVSLAHLDPGNF